MICSENDHQSRKCPELSASLYGKMGEGGQKGHSHEEDSVARVSTNPTELEIRNTMAFAYMLIARLL